MVFSVAPVDRMGSRYQLRGAHEALRHRDNHFFPNSCSKSSNEASDADHSSSPILQPPGKGTRAARLRARRLPKISSVFLIKGPFQSALP